MHTRIRALALGLPLAFTVAFSSSSSRADAPAPAAPSETTKVHPAEAPAVEVRVLDVRIAGKPFAKWTAADLAKRKPLPAVDANGGKATLYALKDMLGALIGPNARLTSVVVTGPQRLVIEEKSWADATRAPVIWQNRRGLFKFGWVDPQGKLLPGLEIRDVIGLDVVKP